MRRGTRHSDAHTAAITATDTAPVTRRLPNSTQPWKSAAGTNSPGSQFGQSLQPSPLPVSRTEVPVMTMATSAHSAQRAMSAKRCGDTLSQRRR